MKNELGDFLRAHRKARGWSLVFASQQLKISKARLSEIERGRSFQTMNPTKPSRELVERMANIYALPVGELLQRAGYPVVEHAGLTDEERQAVELFGRIRSERRQLALSMLRLFAEGD